MPLNHFGKLAAAEIAFYAPILCIAFFVTLKKGFNRREGWIYLLTFSLMGACVTLASQLEKNAPIGLFVAAGILQGIGLPSLLLATLGFVTLITQYGSSSVTRSVRFRRLIRITLLVAVILRIVGGTEQDPTEDPATLSQGRTLTEVGSILFMVAFVALFVLHVFLWVEKEHIPPNHRKLLFGVSLALPPLFVRLIYGLAGAFAPPQSRWSPISGSLGLYLVMGLIMEYLVVCVYVLTGALTPLDKDVAPPPNQTEQVPLVGTYSTLPR